MRALSADVGGTFTDLVFIDGPTGLVHLDKVPSTPGRADAILDGIRRVTAKGGLRPADADVFVHGFTVGTNAFLTRNGARVVLVVSRGMRDVLEIGNQLRPELYRLVQSRPGPVVPRSRVVEAEERRDAFGAVVEPLGEAEATRVADAVAALAPEAVAICLGFAHMDPAHEETLERALARAVPGVPVYLSSRVNPQIEEFPRANTTAIAAYVGPVIDRYVATLDQALATSGIGAPLRLMRSDGGVATVRAARDNPAAMLLSGPAGGVVAGASMAAAMGVGDLVTFDMGGTSADFSVIAGGEPRMVTARKVDGQPLRIPTLDIETISAGGGSIAHVDLGGGLRVGPQSAGAEPGPACYGTGGRDATVTDAAVVLGIIDPAEFLGGEMRLDAALAREAVERNVARPLGLDAEAAALGIVRVANANMVQAIRRISVERGLDIRRFALLAFGGAGPIYGPFMARDLGMSEVLVPRNPGVFAAQGLLMADIRHSAQAALQRRLARIDGADLAARFAVLRERLDALLARDGVAPEDRSYRYAADMRCVGQFHELVVPLPAPGPGAWWDPAAIAATFHDVHERSYGHADRAVPVEVINLRVDGLGRAPRVSPRPVSAPASGTPRPAALRAVCLDPGNGYRETPVHRRDDLRPGHVLNGPAIVTQRDTTTVVLPGQQATVAANDVIRIGAAP